MMMSLSPMDLIGCWLLDNSVWNFPPYASNTRNYTTEHNNSVYVNTETSFTHAHRPTSHTHMCHLDTSLPGDGALQ